MPDGLRAAVVFYGGVSRYARSTRTSDDKSLVRQFHGEPIDIRITAKSHHWSFIDRGKVDIFIHSWAIELHALLEELYHPIAIETESSSSYVSLLRSHVHPKQRDCSNQPHFCVFNTVSSALSMQKAITMVMSHESRAGFRYDWVLLMRPDLIFSKRVTFWTYNHSRVTLNGQASDRKSVKGDHMRVMSSESAQRYGGLFAWFRNTSMYGWGLEADFVKQVVTPGLPPIPGDVEAPVDEDVFRKLCFQKMGISRKSFSNEDWLQLRSWGVTCKYIHGLPSGNCEKSLCCSLCPGVCTAPERVPCFRD